MEPMRSILTSHDPPSNHGEGGVFKYACRCSAKWKREPEIKGMLCSCRWRFYASCFCRQIGGFQFSMVSGGSERDNHPTRRAALRMRCSWALPLLLLMCPSRAPPPCQALTRFPASALIGKNRWWMGQLGNVTSLLLPDWGQEQTSVSVSFGCFWENLTSSLPWIKLMDRKWPKYKWERTPCVSTVARKGL